MGRDALGDMLPSPFIDNMIAFSKTVKTLRPDILVEVRHSLGSPKVETAAIFPVFMLPLSWMS